jgi:hypothetical protein
LQSAKIGDAAKHLLHPLPFVHGAKRLPQAGFIHLILVQRKNGLLAGHFHSFPPSLTDDYSIACYFATAALLFILAFSGNLCYCFYEE